MRAGEGAAGRAKFSLDPLTPDEAAALAGCRQLAILLSALDMRYLPRIMLEAHHARVWEAEDPGFDIGSRLGMFGLEPEALAATASSLLFQAEARDPLGSLYDLIRQAHPGAWSGLRGAALLCMESRIAAEVLLRSLDDLGRLDLSMPPPRKGRMAGVTLDHRLMPEPERLEEILSDVGLSTRPAVLLVLEGATEMQLMPRVLAKIYGKSVPATLVELVDMKTITRDLDLLVRHEAGPRLGNDIGDVVSLARPLTRVLVAVDAERDYSTRPKQRRQQVMLATRLYDSLPKGLRSPQMMRQMQSLVHVTTWGTVPWEFANFSDAELAAAITRCTALPSGMSRRDLIAALRAERVIKKARPSGRSPDVEKICTTWPSKFSKLALAEELWPVLEAKVGRELASGKRPRVPAARIGIRALRLAVEHPRRNVALRVR
jgi:hypothetical protein